MTYQRRAYDDLDPAGQMTRDCVACADRVELPRQRHALGLGAVLAPTPRRDVTADSRATTRPDIELARAAAHLAARLHLA